MNKENLQISRLSTRFTAHIIDLMISFMITMLFVINITSATSTTTLFDAILNSVILVILLFWVSWHLIFSYLESKFGGTPGKLVTGIRIVDDKNKYLSLKKALFRNYIGRTAASLFLGLGYVWMFKDEQKQGWHDMVTGSYVVTKNKNGLWIGLIILIVTIVLTVLMVNIIVINISQNQEMYRSLISSVQLSL